MRKNILYILLPTYWVCFSAFSQIMTHIPSETADPFGLAVQITLPKAKHFAAGAPVVVFVPGGFDSNGLPDSGINLDDLGFIKIAFSWPGRGNIALDQKSGGVYDTRGLVCLKALRDVVLFAMNKKADKTGKKLSDWSGSIAPNPANVGMAGLSNGGNATLACAGIFADTLSSLAWIVNWESPVGDGMPGTEAGMVKSGEGGDGASNPKYNPAYDDSTGNWDLSTLAYSDTVNINKGHITIPGATLRGGLYFDINRNGVPTWGTDFIVMPVSVVALKDTMVYYSDRLRKEADNRRLFPAKLPKHIPTAQATQDFWNYRNGEKWIPSILQKIRNLMFIVVAFETDHVQSAPDHPHVLIQYEGFRGGGGRFVRLNPDKAYVETLMAKSVSGVPDNNAFKLFDHLTIRGSFLPNAPAGVPLNIGVAAAVWELADRIATSNLNPQLSDVISGVRMKAEQPVDFTLLQNYPNPFNGSTVISFKLTKPEWVDMAVFNVQGECIRVLQSGKLSEGSHEWKWDGTNHRGQAVSSGLYLCSLKTGTTRKTMKMIYNK